MEETTPKPALNKAHLRLIAVCVLLVVLLIEIVYLNVLAGRVNELRKRSVPAAANKYTKIRENLNEIREYMSGTGASLDARQGAPSLSEINELARNAGISKTPNVRQWTGNTRNKDYNEHMSEIKVFNTAAKQVFSFLKSLDSMNPASRIKVLSVSQSRGKTNEFDLTIQYATYSPKQGS